MEKLKLNVPTVDEMLKMNRVKTDEFAKEFSDQIIEAINEDINNDLLNVGHYMTFDCLRNLDGSPIKEDMYELSKRRKDKKTPLFEKYIVCNHLFRKIYNKPSDIEFHNKVYLNEIINKNKELKKYEYQIILLIRYKFIGSIFYGYDNWKNSNYEFPKKFPKELNDTLRELFPVHYYIYDKFYDMLKEYFDKGYKMQIVDYFEDTPYSMYSILTISLLSL